MEKWNKITSWTIILTNFVYLYFTVIILSSTGQAMDYGLLLLPATVFFHLFLIPALITIVGIKFKNKTLFIFNVIGSSLAVLFLLLFIL